MWNLTAVTGSQAYLALLRELLENGAAASPRDLATRELLDVTITIGDPDAVHVLRTARKTPPRIAATEATHLVAGISSLEQLDLASGGRFSQFADRGRLRGAYGPRTWHQLGRAVARLAEDASTRQAFVTVWHGEETALASRDVPCTASFQFLIRDGQLRMRTTMRSNDAWLGFPIDLEMFSCLHRTLAVALGIPAGPYTHTVASMHLYDRNLLDAEMVVQAALGAQSRGSIPAFAADDELSGPLARWSRASHLAFKAATRASPEGLPAQYVIHVPQLPPSCSFCPRCRYVVPGYCTECRILFGEPGELLDEDALG
jgi:thymidylate synthase